MSEFATGEKEYSANKRHESDFIQADAFANRFHRSDPGDILTKIKEIVYHAFTQNKEVMGDVPVGKSPRNEEIQQREHEKTFLFEQMRSYKKKIGCVHKALLKKEVPLKVTKSSFNGLRRSKSDPKPE